MSKRLVRLYTTSPNYPKVTPNEKALTKAVQETLDQRPLPSDDQVLNALRIIEKAALDLCGQNESISSPGRSDGSATSAILSLNGRARSKPPPARALKAPNHEITRLSHLAHRLLKDPRVFITPEALGIYVTIQTVLCQPHSFPEIFQLYAGKPQAQASKADTEALSYEIPKPDAAASAIPVLDANLAVDSAIQVRNLPLALSIINESFQRPAFRKSKFVRNGLLPIVGAAATPAAAWILASSLSEIQINLPQETFTQIAFAGFATYAATVGTIGYVALTSANDQMKRVTWAVGTPLRERWVREEERSALDRVACAWGFKDTWRWGEEEGRDWEELKEWIGMHGMVLDKVGLMEGME